jgi:arsenite methyltransferase
VFNEMYRLLKPGGRVAISDILARKELTEDMKKNISLYVGCISGASQVSEYNTYLTKAGFGGESDIVCSSTTANYCAIDVLVVDSKNDLNVYMTGAEGETSCCGAVTENKCCIPEQKETGCQPGSSTCSCQDETSMANETHQLAAALGIVDFNEWAGMMIAALQIIGYANAWPGSFQVYAVKPLKS